MRARGLTTAVAPVVVATLALALTPRVALADGTALSPGPTKEQCFDAYEQAQRLRGEYRLRAAHEQLITCGAVSCPTFVQRDCEKWLGEVEASTPTIVIVARGAGGSAIENAHVILDGQPFADRLDGLALPVDPGPHDLQVQVGDAIVQMHIVVAEGGKNQPFSVLIPAPAPPVERVPAPPPPARPIPAATWILGGVALAGAVSFAAFGLSGRAVQACAPNCTTSQVADLRRDYLIADVSWITGLVAAGAALYFALTASPEPAPTTALRW
jgi:hypothetical protein